jgi:hypothetical protein
MATFKAQLSQRLGNLGQLTDEVLLTVLSLDEGGCEYLLAQQDLDLVRLLEGVFKYIV